MARPLSIDDQITLPSRDKDAEGEQITKGDAIVRAITLGAPREMAAQAAGVDPTTFYRWVAVGAEFIDLDDEAVAGLEPKQQRLRQFCQDVKRADAQAVVFAVELVADAMPKDWKAAMTWLERRYPGEWGKRVEVKVDPPERQPAPMDGNLAEAAANAFATAALPPGLDPDDFLPDVASADEAAEAPA